MQALSRVGGCLLSGGGCLLSATFTSLFEKLKEHISDQLFEKLKEYVSDQLGDSKEGIGAQIESWKTLLPKIIGVLQHAEENQAANLFVKSYFDDLRDLAYDMEDILEEFVIDTKNSELVVEFDAGAANKRQKIASNVMNSSIFKAKPNQKIDSMMNHLNVRFQRIEKEMHTFGLINLIMKAEDNSHKVATKRVYESAVLEDQVCGRDNDKKAILDRLLEDGGSLEQDFVIPIVGMGGLGKTTLARLIYNDEKLKGKFDLMAWVCVSEEFDVDQITRTILQQVTTDRCDYDSGLLQVKLREKLSGRKFFLVLDDVWNKKYGLWDVVKRPFMSGALGSKIIVTTRDENVGRMMRGDDRFYKLELLQEDACLPLFARHALGKENFDVHLDLRDVGKKLIERCKRLPLALKTLGGVLRGKLHHDEWEKILNSDIWSSSEDGSGILPALRLSYNHLPSHLKQCFAYCALFPKDHEFDKKVLVRLWMAEGLLQQQSRVKKQMEEETGHQCFQELLSRSLFQQSSKDESQFVMHDLINDLAVDVAGEMYCNLEGSMGDEKLKKTRHLSFTPHFFVVSKRFKDLGKLQHFRTFLSLRAHSGYIVSYLSNEIVHDFLSTLNRLRVLSLCGYSISKLPVSFENLKHIRYIDLSYTRIKCLPESVDSLLFLQTLLLSGCGELTELPTTIGNLIDLHHLDINATSSLKKMPSGIGNLKNLVTLSKFIVGKANGMMRLPALKNLSQLQGRLSILGLKNVLDVRDAEEANLANIHGLEELVLEFGGSTPDQHESVLNLLEPHSNLRSLAISCYDGRSFPDWVYFLNLSYMKLSYCQECTLLPSLGLLPVLKKLSINCMTSIEAVGGEFYGRHDSFRSLEELEFEVMVNWKEWTSLTGSASEFPCLRRLVIKHCPELGQLPGNLSSLKELDVVGCNAMLFTSMVDLTSLTELRLQQISELTCLPKSLIQSLTLETLRIEICHDLIYLWEEGVETEQSLLPFNLKLLCLLGCGALESLPDAMMMRMLRLETLTIRSCPLKSFPRGKLPISLKYLTIGDCDDLESLPDADGDNNNSNLHLKIWNVPCLYSSEGCHQLSTFLKNFEVQDCEWLESFPERMLQHCTGLQSINLNNCKILKSLPTLDCTPNLQDLRIGKCESFKSLPNTMYKLKSLRSLYMYDCPGIVSIPDGGLPPNLEELQLWCKNLERVPNTMYRLTSLQSLRISGRALRMGLQRLTSLQQLTIEQEFPPRIVLPSSLTSLEIVTEENLESIPGRLFQNLSSLETLKIVDWPKLQSLPREAFRSLGQLDIRGCPHLKRQDFEEKGDYWTDTRYIRIEIRSDEGYFCPNDWNGR